MRNGLESPILRRNYLISEQFGTPYALPLPDNDSKNALFTFQLKFLYILQTTDYLCKW